MMTNSEFADFMVGATWGAEVDMGGADRKIPLPPGNTWCPTEEWGCNDAGICVDPTLTYNCFGGELQTRPCGSPGELVKTIGEIGELVIPNYEPDRPTTLPLSVHIHIRVPALLENPDVLKHLLIFGEEWERRLMKVIYVSLDPDLSLCRGDLEYRHYEWGDRSMRISRNTHYPALNIDRAVLCDDVPSMIKALHPNWTDMKNENNGQYAAQYEEGQPRLVNSTVRPPVNYGHILINETVEFRVFYGSSLKREYLTNMAEFPAKYLYAALVGGDPMELVEGVTFAERGIWGTEADPSYMRARRANTDLYQVDSWQAEDAVRFMLGLGEISLADINHPQLFIDEGFE